MLPPPAAFATNMRPSGAHATETGPLGAVPSVVAWKPAGRVMAAVADPAKARARTDDSATPRKRDPILALIGRHYPRWVTRARRRGASAARQAVALSASGDGGERLALRVRLDREGQAVLEADRRLVAQD